MATPTPARGLLPSNCGEREVLQSTKRSPAQPPAAAGFRSTQGREEKAASWGRDPEALIGDPAAGLRAEAAEPPPTSQLSISGLPRAVAGAEHGFMWIRS